MKKRGYGFTLIELLMIVATIAILAAISVPNFLEAQTRAKTSRAYVDMAMVKASLKAYLADYNVYPPNDPDVHEFLQACAGVTVVNNETLPTPMDARIPWTSGAASRFEDRRSWGGKSVSGYPPLDVNSSALNVLTTPIAYFSQGLPVDVFHDKRPGALSYINFADVFTTEALTLLPSRPARYLVFSYGPNTDSSRPDIKNPVKGPFLPYDPTNGTVSAGDILSFDDGRSSMSLFTHDE